MNFSRPIYIILIGSSILAFLVLITLVLIENTVGTTIDSSLFISIPLVVFFMSLVLFTLLVGRFINRKIQFIYRIISNKHVAEESIKYGMSDNVLTKLSEDTAKWAKLQQKQIKDLKEQAEFRKEFLGNLAHELKTPVFSIQGYILTLLEGGLEDERVNRDFLERTLGGVDRILHLLEDLDQISKYETDRFQLKLTKFDVVELTRSVFAELESKSERKDIQLKLKKHFEPIYVVADKKRITQVMVNLISNSISYGKEDGQTTINFVSQDRSLVLIEVTDNGLGMAEEHITRLFERFYRVDKSRERNKGGSGLGLSIVKHIMEAHNQKINVRSTEGVGSTFSFTLKKA